MPDLLKVEHGHPGYRQQAGIYAATLRHFPTDTSAAAAVTALGLAWPVAAGSFVGNDPWLAWRAPRESLLLSHQRAAIDMLLQSLAPGRSETAMAAELSDGLMTWELHGPLLDEWLVHLVDASALPRQAGRASRARMADVAVFMLRLEADRLWLIADRSMSAYVANWLAFSHEGAFAATKHRA